MQNWVTGASARVGSYAGKWWGQQKLFIVVSWSGVELQIFLGWEWTGLDWETLLNLERFHNGTWGNNIYNMNYTVSWSASGGGDGVWSGTQREGPYEIRILGA